MSHNGRFVLSTSNRTGGYNLWRIPLDGSSARQVTFGDSESLGQLSPDDKWIVFMSVKSGKRLLHRMSIEGGHDTILSSIPIYPYSPALSPDGKLVAFEFMDQARHGYRLGVIPFAGGTPIATFDIPRPSIIEWTRDGKALTYKAVREGVDNLWVQPVAGGPARQITNFNEGHIFRFAWRRDGKQLAIARGEVTSDIVALQRTD